MKPSALTKLCWTNEFFSYIYKTERKTILISILIGIPMVEKSKIQSKVKALLQEYNMVVAAAKRKEEIKAMDPAEKVFGFYAACYIDNYKLFIEKLYNINISLNVKLFIWGKNIDCAVGSRRIVSTGCI
jgi:hypothetical protein